MALDSVQHVVVRVPDTDEQSLLPEFAETLRSRTHRSRRDIVCWHCGRRGHMRQRCFRRMRQHRKRKLHGTQMADTTTISPCPLFQRLLLDMSAVSHVIPHREWFSTYSAVRHDCADMDSLGSDVVGVGDVHLKFADGASMVLHDVRHMPTMTECLVSIPCLRGDGYAFMHTEHSWRIHRGSLVVARGACCGIDFPLFPSYIRAGAVYVVALPCRKVERHRVSFQDAVFHAVEHDEPEVQCLSIERHVESTDSSMVALQGQSSILVTDLAIEPYTEALFYDACDAFEVDSDLDTAVQDMSAVEYAIALVEHLCSSESQQCIVQCLPESDCTGADSSVLQSFSDMPLPDDADMVMHGQVVPEDAYSTEVADRDRLAEIVHVSSAFGSLMHDLLASRPDLAYAVGAFAVGAVSRSMTDIGIVHCGALQVLTRYLHEVHVCSSSVAHSEWSLERIQVHAHTWSEPVGVG